MQSRRHFLADLGALGALGSAVACRASSAPVSIAVTERSVLRVLPGVATSDGAGVKLTRVIGQPALRHLDPFILLDRIHSDDPTGYLAGFPDHPHRGFETVSIMLEGNIRHRDSKGNHGLIVGGGAQWMTAGRGIVHSEMPEQAGGLLSGFQLWVNLPAREKMCTQFYQDLQPSQLLQAPVGAGGHVRVIAGAALGVRGPVRARPTEPILLTLTLADDAPFDLDLPSDHSAFVFVHTGALTVGARTVEAGELALLGPGNRVRMRARDMKTGALFAAGKPLREPIVQRGPFVMNTEEEIRRAFADYRAGTLDV